MKKRFCLMLAFSALLILSACRGEKLSIDDLLDRGTAAAQNGDWEKAREYAKRAVKLVPSNVNALVLNALALENTGDPDGALDEVSKAVSIDEANYFAQYTKGRLLYEKKKYDSCVAPLRAALTLSPNAPDPLILLAQAAVMLQNGQDVRIYYSRLARIPQFARNPIPWSELGMYYLFSERNAPKAKDYLNYAYTLRRDNPTLLLNLAIYFDVHMNNKAEARKLYTRFLNMTQRNSSMSQTRAAVEKRLKVLK